MTATTRTRLLLVGAGHAHLHVIDRAAGLAAAGIDLTLLAPARFHYSGLATAVATGQLPSAAATIDVASLAARRGVRHHEGRAVDWDADRRTVTTETGDELGYDVVSFNVGSVAATDGMEVASEVAAVKPFEQLFALSRWVADARPERRHRISVVGGGPTGLELAGQLAARLGRRTTVTVFERGPQPGAALPSGARRRVLGLLGRRGVVMRAGVAVSSAHPDHLVADGHVHHHDLVVIATGLEAAALARAGPCGGPGGMRVRATLQHLDHDDVYAVGDAASFTPRPLPKLGVHAVRQGRVLERSLLARQAGRPLPVYRPRRQALQILDLGGGTALATRGRWWAEGPGMRRLKLAIDRRWLSRYQ